MANVWMAGWSSMIRRPRDGRAVQIMLRFIMTLDDYELRIQLVEKILLTGPICLLQCSPLIALAFDQDFNYYELTCLVGGRDKGLKRFSL